MAEYPDNVRRDEIYTFPIEGGELKVSPSYDFLNYFPWLDRWILKYWNTDSEPPTFCDVMLPNKSAEFLIAHCDLEVCSRTFIGESERERLLAYDSEHIEDWLI